jgi:hypothetical protein
VITSRQHGSAADGDSLAGPRGLHPRARFLDHAGAGVTEERGSHRPTR